jgi:hypothetical protein
MLRPFNRVSSAANSIGAAALVLALAACGARPSLWLGDSRPGAAGGNGGTGGSTSTTTSSTGVTTTSTSSSSSTTSSSSGTGPACVPLVEVALPAVDGFHARRPALVALDGKSSVAAVLGLDAVVASEPPAVPIADAVLDAWGPWPPAVAAPHVVAPDGGSSFAVAARAGAKLALFATVSGGMLADGVDPLGSAALQPLTGLNGATGAGFLAANGQKLAVGITRPLSDSVQGLVFSVLPENETWGGFGTTCSNGALVGDAMPLGDQFLIAAATSVPVTSCGFSFVGPPRDVRLFRHVVPKPSDPDTVFKPIDDVLQVGSLVRLRLSPRSDGAWLFAQVNGLDDHLEGVRAYRVSADAHVLGEGADVVAAGRTGFAAAPRGDGFALAWIEDPGPNAAALGVATFDANGAQVATQIYPLPAGASVTDPLAMQVSPDGAMLLVAWSQATPSAADSVHLVRFGCSG